MNKAEIIINREVKEKNCEILGNLLLELIQMDKKNKDRVEKLYFKY